jgi:preprotein translocase subunit Sec61beta
MSVYITSGQLKKAGAGLFFIKCFERAVGKKARVTPKTVQKLIGSRNLDMKIARLFFDARTRNNYLNLCKYAEKVVRYPHHDDILRYTHYAAGFGVQSKVVLPVGFNDFKFDRLAWTSEKRVKTEEERAIALCDALVSFFSDGKDNRAQLEPAVVFALSPLQRQAMLKLFAYAEGDGDSRHVCRQFLLSWWDSERFGGFSLQSAGALHPTLKRDLLMMVSFLVNRNIRANQLGGEMDQAFAWLVAGEIS